MDPNSVDAVMVEMLSKFYIRANSKKSGDRVRESIMVRLKSLHDLCQLQKERADQRKGFEEIATAYFAVEDIAPGTDLEAALKEGRQRFAEICKGKSYLESLLNSESELETILDSMGTLKQAGGDWYGFLKEQRELAKPGSMLKSTLERLEEYIPRIEMGDSTIADVVALFTSTENE